MEIRTHLIAQWSMNAYALVCPATGQSVLIDPGAQPDALQALLAGTEPVTILITHKDPDHIGALDDMRQRLGVPVLGHPGPNRRGMVLPVDRPLDHGDTVEVGNCQLRVHYTPGHSPDMLSFEVAGEEAIVVGDTIFDGGPARPGRQRTSRRRCTPCVRSCWPGPMRPCAIPATVRPSASATGARLSRRSSAATTAPSSAMRRGVTRNA